MYRQKVAEEGYLSLRDPQAAPVLCTHKMLSIHVHFEARLRPRLSRCRFGTGNNGSINVHFASVNK
jgi:hypothetical protein